MSRDSSVRWPCFLTFFSSLAPCIVFVLLLFHFQCVSSLFFWVGREGGGKKEVARGRRLRKGSMQADKGSSRKLLPCLPLTQNQPFDLCSLISVFFCLCSSFHHWIGTSRGLGVMEHGLHKELPVCSRGLFSSQKPDIQCLMPAACAFQWPL